MRAVTKAPSVISKAVTNPASTARSIGTALQSGQEALAGGALQGAKQLGQRFGQLGSNVGSAVGKAFAPMGRSLGNVASRLNPFGSSNTPLTPPVEEEEDPNSANYMMGSLAVGGSGLGVGPPPGT